MRTVLLCCLAACATGPASELAVEVENQYAESIFRLSCSTDGGQSWVALSSHRLDYGESSEAASCETAEDFSFAVQVVATSLGDDTTFVIKGTTTGPDAALGLVYDYDLALAIFKLSTRLADVELE